MDRNGAHGPHAAATRVPSASIATAVRKPSCLPSTTDSSEPLPLRTRTVPSLETTNVPLLLMATGLTRKSRPTRTRSENAMDADGVLPVFSKSVTTTLPTPGSRRCNSVTDQVPPIRRKRRKGKGS